MNREQAEMLLAELVFDELDEPTKAQLLAYLETDAELSERLGDLRLTAGLLREGVAAGKPPKLDEKRRAKILRKLDGVKPQRSPWSITLYYGVRIAACLALLALIVGLLLPALGTARRSARQMQSNTQLRGIHQGMVMYAQSHGGVYPDDLTKLLEEDYFTPEYMLTPQDADKEPRDFKDMTRQQKQQWVRQESSYVPLALGEKETLDSKKIVGFEKFGQDKQGVSVAFGDNHTAWLSTDEARKLIEQQTGKSPEQLTDNYRRTGNPMAGEQLAKAGGGNFGMDWALGDVSGVRSNQDWAGISNLHDVDIDGSQLGNRLGWYAQDTKSPERSFHQLPAAPLASRPQAAVDMPIIEKLPDTDSTESGGGPFGETGIKLSQSEKEQRLREDQAGQPWYVGRRVDPSGEHWYLDPSTVQLEKPLSAKPKGKQEQESLSSLRIGAPMEPLKNEQQQDYRLGVQGQRMEEQGGQQVRRLPLKVYSGQTPSSATLNDKQKQAQVNDLLVQARELQKDMKYDQANDVLDQAMSLDPDNVPAKAMKEMNEDATRLVEARQITRDRNLYRAALRTADGEKKEDGDAQEAVRHPVDWPELTQQRVAAVTSEPSKNENKPQDEPRPIPPQPLVPVNPWVLTEKDRLSTFAIDVDTASYAIAAQSIHSGKLPPPATVRMEEFVNAFDYNYPTLHDTDQTFAVLAEAAPSPFGKDVTLLKVAVRGKVLGRDQLKPAHYVFVIDASGSMDTPDRLPLVQRSLGRLLDQLSENDRVSIVTYNTTPSLIAEAVSASKRDELRAAINAIQCQGSTNLLDGITLGYQTARQHYLPGGVNRVILCSDGVANVGPSDADQLLENVAAYHDHGIGFTSVGFGAGSYDDHLLEQLADRGDGSYLYIGSDAEAERWFVQKLAATSPPIARNVKIQVEFDPARVRRYRLIGYENRAVADADFRNDAVKGGQVNSGQCATALYELELLGPELNADDRPDLGTVYVRYQEPEAAKVQEIAAHLPSSIVLARTPQNDPRFYLAACAARFAELLRGSEHAAGGNFVDLKRVMEQVAAALPLDVESRQLNDLIGKAEGLPPAVTTP